MPSEYDAAPMATKARGRHAARTGRILRRWWPGISAVMAGALVTASLTATSAHAATPRAVTTCASGYLCLFKPDGTVVRIPGGGSKDYPNGLRITKIANESFVTYCVDVGIFETINPGEVQDWGIIYEAFPEGVCPR